MDIEMENEYFSDSDVLEEVGPFDGWSEVLDLGVARVPLVLLQGTAAMLQGSTSTQQLPRAWMSSIAQNFPDTPLGELRSKDPSLLPAWLLQDFARVQVKTYITGFCCVLGTPRSIASSAACCQTGWMYL
jgi:hypothetical protein